MTYSPERQLVRTLALISAGLAVLIGLFFFVPWAGSSSQYATRAAGSVSLYEMAFDSPGTREYQMTAFYVLAVAVALVACIPGATLAEDIVRARIRAVAFALVASTALQFLLVDWMVNEAEVSIKAGVWLTILAAIGGAGVSAWTSAVAEPDEAAEIPTGLARASGLVWGSFIAYLALDFLDTLEQISSQEIPKQFAGEFRTISLLSTGFALAVAFSPVVLRALRNGSLGQANWGYGQPAAGFAQQASVLAPVGPAPAGNYGGAATQVVAALPPSRPLEPRYVVTTRYNGVVLWEDWRNLVNPLERLAANAQLDVVGEVEGYFEVQGGGRRGYVAKGAVR